jgi:hypothetical protein
MSKVSGKKIAGIAARILKGKPYSDDETKQLAASVLAQAEAPKAKAAPKAKKAKAAPKGR